MFRTQAISYSTTNLTSLPARLVDTVLLWQERSAQRQRLAELDARQLADMGLSRGQAQAEAAKPFWQA